ncbi:beta-galactosidase [Mycolicibacterium flavescens]|uniref:Uncharacterized protein n=1 Tax=Mycolicibacterium flavescens TaxID=1776 RepID=A0A1E3RH54_MYCFV|nr:beta-galactosidase [Mycolicibacterium flavescens]ODQ89181.1 hypothetical protein BHQ18_16475 [Mycolicibacterium flavescens]
MRAHRIRRPSRLSTTIVALLSGVVTVTAIAVGLPSDSPRRVVVAPSANIEARPTTIGIADADVYGMTQADVERTLRAMGSTNVRTVRLMIPWAGVEPLQGQLNWSMVDKTVNAAAARGMSILGFINSTPAWAVAPGGFPISGRPASPAAYGEFAAKVAARYKGKIAAYEIWNEPNSAQFYSPTPDPAGYTDLLRAAYPRIKAVDPAVTVIGGVVGSVIDWGNFTWNPVRFVQGMYDAGAGDYLDALSFHPYHYQLKFSDGVPVANSAAQQLMDMRQIMVANGDSGKKIWNTEYGQPTSAVDEAGQAAFLTDMWTKWQELPYTGPLYLYTTRDRRTGSTSDQDTFGLLRTDWTPKQAQQALQFAIPAGPAKSAEYKRFAAVTAASHGTVLSPVFRASPTVWAQIRTVNALFEMPSGMVASPRDVARVALARKGVPKTPFANGFQDFDAPNAFRVWWSPATGAHWASAAFAQAWVPQLGLATSDETYLNGLNRVDFQNGYMTWQPWIGIKVYLN